MTQIPITIPQKRLAQSITASSTSFKLNNITGWDDENLVTADLGSQHFVVLMNETKTAIEIIEIDPATIASASITILKRGLDFGGAETEVVANKLAWTANETIVQLGTDVPQLLNNFVDKGREQTITGMKSVPTPTAAAHIATKAYVDLAALGGATVDKVVVAGTAGEIVAAGNLVYFDLTDNEWKKCDADTAATVENVKLGIAQGAGTNGVAISGGVLLSGIDTNQSGMTQGDLMYASNTAGGIASSTGTTERVIGIARTATNLYFNPEFYYTVKAKEKAAMVGSYGTPSTTNKFVTQEDPAIGAATLTAGATITGATLPVPVYQNKTDSKVYACDSNDTTAYKFIGFAFSDGTNNNPISVQFNGVLDGFTGLTVGEKYYVQDAVGTIGVTPGTMEILVGVAISTTNLLIMKGSRRLSGIQEFGSTLNVTITTGFRPTKIRISAVIAVADTDGHSHGLYSLANGNICVGITRDSTTSIIINSSIYSWYVFRDATGVSQGHRGDVANVTDTGFMLSNTKVGTPPSGYLCWEAEGEL